MTELLSLIKRNTKLFFKDKGMLFASMITPLILLVLYVTFLAKVYRDSFLSSLPEAMRAMPGIDSLIDGCVGSQLFSSLLAVSCITVAFCSNLMLVQDKVTGAKADLTITPVKRSTLAVGYYISSVLVTLIVCLFATGICFLYLAKVGWYLSFTDVLLLLLDIFLLILFGTALSSVIFVFLSTQGQISAVGTVVSAGYGFICGAYMPISFFGKGLQNALSFFPGIYGTALLRSHAMQGVFKEMSGFGFPNEVICAIKSSVDCSPSFFGDAVSIGAMYAVLCGSIAVLLGLYIALHYLCKKDR